MHVLLLDNIDSFTWNLAQLIRAEGATCTVMRKDECTLSDVQKITPDRIVLSPGPGHPKDAHLSLEIISAVRDGALQVPILGVCLGHQCMGHCFGSAKTIGLAETAMHGKTSSIHHTGTSIFRGVPSPFMVARYHSLIVRRLPKDFELLAWTIDSPLSRRGGGGTIMAMRHRSLPLIGVQFHPESFMTAHGSTLIKNFLSGS